MSSVLDSSSPVAIITGASKGIGAGLVAGYRSAGYAVVGVERFGRVDTLINNAGIYIGKPFTEYRFDDFTAITAVNLTGFFRITQLASRPVASSGG